MPHADRGKRTGDLAPLGRRGDCESLAETPTARVDSKLPPGLGVDEIEEPDVRQLLLARVSDLDRDHVMVPGELQERSAPLLRAAEIRDDDHQRTLPGERAGSEQRTVEGARAGAVRRRLGSGAP